MTYKCCVPGCNNTGSKIFHSFPKEKVKCKRWIYNTKCFHLNSETAHKTHHKVCKDHFAHNDYTSTMHKFLKSNAVPSLNLPGIDEAKKYLCSKNGPNQSLNDCFVHSNELPVASHSGQQENVFENLEPSTKFFTEREISSGSEHPISKNDNQNQVSNSNIDAWQVQMKSNTINDSNKSNEQLETRDADDECDCSRMDVTENCDDSAKNAFTITDVLVPEFNKTSGTPIQTNEKVTKIRAKYDPAARRTRYQTTRIKFLKQKLRDSEKLKSSNILNYLEKRLDQNQMTFVRIQLRNAGRKPRGHRFTFEEKCMAFAIYKQSPKCYRHLSDLFTLPCKQTLMTHSAHVRFEAGLSPTLMAFLSDVVKGMDKLDKIVTLGWDEMSLSAHLDYCKVKDYIDGFVDDGNKTTDEFATHALVFMVRGVNKSFKQPIAYFLTSNINKSELAELIKLITEAVMDAGLKVVGSVCDAVATNRAAIKSLMSPELARLPEHRLNILEYRIRNESIIHFFDPPHLIKSVRNNMLTKDLIHYVATKKCTGKADQVIWDPKVKKERVASWDDLKEFHRSTEQGINELLPNIKDEHLEPKKKKMKVSVAVQVFSRTVGTTMRYCSEHKQLDKDFTGTADLFIFFNEVFDSLNGGNTPSVKNSLKGSIHQDSYHFTFWKYAVEMLKKMKFVPKDPEKQEQSKVLNDYVLTINGLAELTKRLFDLKVEFVSISRMTQDALENFFGGIRSYCQAAVCPTPRNFRCAYATSVLNNLSSSHSIKSNCEEDGGFPLIRDLLYKFMTTKCAMTAEADVDENDLEDDIDSATKKFSERTLSKSENEAGNCLAGHVCKIVLQQTQCTDCEKSISSRAKTDKYHGLMIARSQYSSSTSQLIMFPKAKFIDSFKKLIRQLEGTVPIYCSGKSLSKFVIPVENANECFAGCDLHKIEFTQKIRKLSSDILINAFTNKVNSLLSGKIEILYDPYDHIQEAALEFRQKKKHIGKYAQGK